MQGQLRTGHCGSLFPPKRAGGATKSPRDEKLKLLSFNTFNGCCGDEDRRHEYQSWSAPNSSPASSTSALLLAERGARRRTRKPPTADRIDPASVPTFAWSTTAGSRGKARAPMNRLMVKPIPHRIEAP